VLAPALEVLAAAGAVITVDLSRLTFCDSQGINLCFRVAQAARESGGSLTLANPTAILRRLFEVVDLDGSIRVIAAPPPVASA
jgi:anti-anti-sigma factor